jgi:hypothetical protein
LLYAGISALSSCVDVVSGKIINAKNSISCVYKVKVGSTKSKLLIYWPFVINCNYFLFTNIHVLSTNTHG